MYNDESTPVDLSGMYLSDDPSSPTLWEIPSGTVIPAKSFLLVWTDDEPLEGPLHANFRLSGAGETVILSHNDANGRVLLDAVTYPFLLTDQSFGRFPDGGEDLQTFCAVTPAAANDNADVPCGDPPPPPPFVYINEFMASNTSTVQDESGEFADWIELYNDESVPVDLSGMHLTDNLAVPSKFEIPSGTIIPAKGFLLLWADNDLLQGPLHTGFRLSATGEQLGLFDTDTNLFQPIHTFSFGPQATDVSEGLLPDGVGVPANNPAPVTQAVPTPGASNGGSTMVDQWRLY